MAQIMIGPKRHFIGYYGDEEEAAVDYARALFKYGGRQQQQQREPALDLSNLPPQTAIQRAAGE